MRFELLIVLFTCFALPLSAAAEEGVTETNLNNASIFAIGSSGMSKGLPIGTEVTSQPVSLGFGGQVEFLTGDESAPSDDTETETAPLIEEPAPTPADISGVWTLNTTENRTLSLSLTQFNSTVFGSAILIAGNDSRMMTAAGDVTADSAALYLVTRDGANLYLLAINVTDSGATGSYQEFGSEGLIAEAPVAGGRSV